MKIKFFAFVSLCLFVSAASGQAPKRLDPQIQKMVREVSPTHIRADILKLVSFGTRNTLSSQDDPNRGVGAARDWIYSEFQRISKDCGNCLDVQKQTWEQPKGSRVPQPATLTNVYAVLKGTTDPDRVYVVSGHYDSMCNQDATDTKCDAPGANDDGSGTAVSIELARVMSKYKFDATIIFLTVPGEEQGLYGSGHFAKEAAANKMNIDGMFDDDIVGGATSYKNAPDRQSIRVFAEGVPTNETQQEARARLSIGGENDSASRQLGRYVVEVARRYSPAFSAHLIYRRDRYGRSGDHVPFLQEGYPAIRFTEPHEDFTHQHQTVKMVNGKQYGDLPQFVDNGYIANAARINLIGLANLALAPARPKNVIMDIRGLTNDTDLYWDANKDADLAGYEVVWRDTTAPFWTNSKWVGTNTHYKFPEMSKDNYFFGVRAVDKQGHRSPVVYPRGGRAPAAAQPPRTQ